MLTEKPWRAEAIARLVAAMFVCVALGAVVQILLRARMLPDSTNPVWFLTLLAGAATSLIAALSVLARAWTAENFPVRAALLFGLLCVGLFLTGTTQKLVNPNVQSTTLAGFAVQILSFQGALLPLLIVFVSQHGVSLGEGFGFKVRPGYALLLGAAVGLGLTPVCLSVHQLIAVFAQHFNLHLPQQDTVFILQLASSWTHRIVFGIATIFVVPLAEEALFRGVLYPKLKQFVPASVAVVVTSLVFAAIHLNALSFVPLVVLAIGLTWLYERTGNLLASFTCHALFNGFNYVMLFVMQTPDAP